MPERTLSPAAIQVLPHGLIGFLQLKNGGKYPQHLGSDTLLPVLDLLDWYLQTNDEAIVTAGFGLAAPGTGVFPELTVPPGQAWYVSHYSVQANAGVGESITVGPIILPASAAASILLGPYTSAVASQTIKTTDIARPFFMGAGDALGFHGTLVAGGAVDLFGLCMFTRLAL